MRTTIAPIVPALALIVVASSAWSADVYVEKMPPRAPCPLSGDKSATDPKGKENAAKNRWRIPQTSDFDNTVTTQALVQPGDDRTRWSGKRAARIRGYVAVVKLGTKKESCNCGAPAPVDSDTHIALVVNKAAAKDKRKYVIIEVTPRLREIMASQNPPFDWSTSTLKKNLLGKYVEFQGWLFFDSAHIGSATNTHPRDPNGNNWRVTCWEIHPVTGFKTIPHP
jgi:hypothetical protein